MESFIERLCQAVFGWLCHQDLTFLNHVDGKPIWLCPRCCGLQLGLLFSFLAARFLNSRIRAASCGTALILGAAAVALMADWLPGQLGSSFSSFLSRLLTGLSTGAAAGIMLLLYRRGLKATSRHAVGDLRAPSALGLMAFAMTAGGITVTQSGWLFQSTVLLLTVFANALIVIHTLYLMVRFRLGRVVPRQSEPT